MRFSKQNIIVAVLILALSAVTYYIFVLRDDDSDDDVEGIEQETAPDTEGIKTEDPQEASSEHLIPILEDYFPKSKVDHLLIEDFDTGEDGIFMPDVESIHGFENCVVQRCHPIRTFRLGPNVVGYLIQRPDDITPFNYVLNVVLGAAEVVDNITIAYEERDPEGGDPTTSASFLSVRAIIADFNGDGFFDAIQKRSNIRQMIYRLYHWDGKHFSFTEDNQANLAKMYDKY